jgi:hypothetical protein
MNGPPKGVYRLIAGLDCAEGVGGMLCSENRRAKGAPKGRVPRNSFHVLGLDKNGANPGAAEMITRTGGNTALQHATLSDRHGGLRNNSTDFNFHLFYKG